MTVRELIENLQKLPEDWKDDQVICFHNMMENYSYDGSEGYDEIEEDEEEPLDEIDDFQNDDPANEEFYGSSQPMIGPVENIARITIIRANKERNLFQMPVNTILLD